MIFLQYNMTHFKRAGIEQNQITKTTLDETNKTKVKKVFKRTAESPSSHESRRSINRSGKDFMPATFIKLTRESEPGECQTDRIDYSGGITTMNKNSFSYRKEQNIGVRIPDLLFHRTDPIHRKVEHLQQEIQLKNRELELITEDRQSLKKQNKLLSQKISQLQQIIKIQNTDIQKFKDDIRKVTIEKRKLESEKLSLNKKIEFLQKFNFSTDTKNLQSLRQNHLEKEIEILKEKMKGEGGGLQSMLEQELASQRQELFNARKLVQSLQISNGCLQRKIQESNCFIFHQQDYSALRNKYKKFLIQYKELRKSFENLQKQNQVLRSRQMVNSCSEDFSLQISLFSALNS